MGSGSNSPKAKPAAVFSSNKNMKSIVAGKLKKGTSDNDDDDYSGIPDH